MCVQRMVHQTNNQADSMVEQSRALSFAVEANISGSTKTTIFAFKLVRYGHKITVREFGCQIIDQSRLYSMLLTSRLSLKS